MVHNQLRMNSIVNPLGLPNVLPSDDDNVSWALRTAHVEWERGARVEAVVWLTRAAASAAEIGDHRRARELNAYAGQLNSELGRATAPSQPAITDPSPIPFPWLRRAEPGAPHPPLPLFEPNDGAVPLPAATTPQGRAIELEAVELSADEVAQVDAEPPDSGETVEISDAELEEDGTFPAAAESQISVEHVPGLGDLPAEGQTLLRHSARVHSLTPDEELAQFDLVLILSGSVSVKPVVADAVCAHLAAGELLYAHASVSGGVSLRIVAGEEGAKVAVWSSEVLNTAMAGCPWAIDELRGIADRYQALAGVVVGPLGERLDETLRLGVTERCVIRRFLPGETVLAKGKPVDGMFLVGAGRLDVIDEVRGKVSVIRQIRPGELVFAREMLAAGKAPHSVRAGQTGALVLFAARHVAYELCVSVPPLLEVIAG